MILNETTDVTAPQDVVYQFFGEMEDSYVEWHPDHITFRWTVGTGLVQGAQAYFKERISGATGENGAIRGGRSRSIHRV